MKKTDDLTPESILMGVCTRLGLTPVKYANLDEVIARNLVLGLVVEDTYSMQKEAIKKKSQIY